MSTHRALVAAVATMIGATSIHVTSASALTGGATEIDAVSEYAPGDPEHAWFESTTIDLTESWGDARACVELTDHTECYRTEKDMLAAHPELEADGDGKVSALAACGSSLRLYANTSYGGSSLALTTRGVHLNMSSYGFDNVTSSYKVGACSSTFYSATNGGGSVYSGNTAAGAQATTMLAGWDNVVSSVYIS